MQFRNIGNSDLKVSTVCLGTWAFGGDCWGEADDKESVRVVREALSRGINFIDTAPIYGSGRSEEIVGQAIKGLEGEVIIATKCGLEQRGPSIRHNLSPGFIRKELEASLKRLGVERIDLYQCHWPDPDTPLEETFTELNKMVSEGKIRYIGVSNFQKGQLEEAREYYPVISDQMQYSLLDRAIEEDLVPFCKDSKVSILAYGPLGGGILSGKYKKPPNIRKSDVRSFFYRFYKEPFWSKARALVDVLQKIASQKGEPVSQAAINWVLSNEYVASCITGCRTVEQLEQNIGAPSWQLEASDAEIIGTASFLIQQ